jgi:hypothetical protein
VSEPQQPPPTREELEAGLIQATTRHTIFGELMELANGIQQDHPHGSNVLVAGWVAGLDVMIDQLIQRANIAHGAMASIQQQLAGHGKVLNFPGGK